MNMNKTKEAISHLLPALAFGAAALGAVHMLTFVWLTAFVYHDNIRGYVPAGLTGLLFLGIASLVLLYHLATVARRQRNRSTPYLLGGCLAVPVAVLGSSVYAGALIALIGYSWQKDAAISSIGGVFCIAAAIVIYTLWLKKRTDNKALEDTVRKLADP